MKLHFILSIIVFFATATAVPNIKGRAMQSKAQEYIAEFRTGKDFNSDESTKELIRGQRVDPTSLRLLVRELAEGTPNVREKVVRLLEHLGLELDQSAPGKIKVIRDREIIKALLTAGFAKSDPAYHLAANILADQCRPADLAEFSQIYIESLKAGEGDYLFLLAKAKINSAADLLEQMTELPKWQVSTERIKTLRIARAALGNTKIENEFIANVYLAEKEAPPAPKNRFYDTSMERDGKDVARQLYNLGLIGTRTSLKVACKFLRSPLKTYVPNHRERSIRYYALDAIRYNYPDEGVLLRPAEYRDWMAAEQFCTDNIGTVFEGPTPNFQSDRSYPIR